MQNRLFAPLPVEIERALREYRAVLADVVPVPPRHRKDLPFAVRRLSQELTSERADGFSPDYMRRADTLSAYLHYFLPWNLFRLARLMRGLNLELPDGALVADLGAGPLTVVQALWLARPDLRQASLRFVCVDRSGSVLKKGRDLFRRLAGEDCPWQVDILQAGMTTRLKTPVDLLVAANALSEYPARRRDDPEDRLSMALLRDVKPGGRMLLVEPGTRAGGRLITSLRERLLEEGLSVLAPCPHTEECPMPGRGNRPWCHFGFETRGAPAWLAELSAAAGLSKARASLSFLYLAAGESEVAPGRVRVVSEPFAVPGGPQARYACAAQGLVLLAGEALTLRDLPSGNLVEPDWPDKPARDAKSGGIILPVQPPPRPKLGAQPGKDRRHPARGEKRTAPKARKPGPKRSGPQKSAHKGAGPRKPGKKGS
jgi:hypothetical protein